MNNIVFVRADLSHEKVIFSWLNEPHMMAYWDNSQEHKDDILNFLHGRKQHYFSGTTQYFVGLLEGVPFAFLLADRLDTSEDLPLSQKPYLSKEGHTVCLDFGIGNKAFLGKGLAVPTLEAFVKYYCEYIDCQTDTFFIDPDENNPRARHVYEKAGFRFVSEYSPTKGAFVGSTSLLMIKHHKLKVKLIQSPKNSEYDACFTGCIILTNDNQILLQKRPENWKTYPGMLAMFGGRMENEETPTETMVRELFEELGAQISSDMLIQLGAVTEQCTNHRELVYDFFWHDKANLIKGCYEGIAKRFEHVDSVLNESKIMDDVRWALQECRNRKLL